MPTNITTDPKYDMKHLGGTLLVATIAIGGYISTVGQPKTIWEWIVMGCMVAACAAKAIQSYQGGSRVAP